MATSTARLTIAALFGAVSTAANSLTSVLDATTDGVGMIHTFVRDASTKQSIRSVVDMAVFEGALHEEKSQEIADRRNQVLSYCAQSAQHNTLYQAAYSEIGAILAARKAA